MPVNQGNFASVDMKQFAGFRFPVPPLEVQREIVRVLDNFTFLSAELSARRKAFMAPKRIELVTKYILDHFDQKTYRGDKTYVFNGVNDND